MIDTWIENGKKNNYLIMLLVKDLEDASYFPVYFNSDKECNIYKNCIISESKLKIIKSYYI
jgi:hypothetical protein